MMRTSLLALVLIMTSLHSIAQDCDSDGISDTAEFGPFFPDGGFGLALEGTAGSSARASVASTDYSLSGQSFTIEFWIYRDSSSANEQYILFNGNQSINQGLVIGFRPDQRFTFAFWGNDLNTVATFPPDDQWHHWVCRYDASNNFRWIIRDGTEVAFDGAPADYLGPNGPFILGGLAGTAGFDGIIDELRIWQGVRSDTSILLDMNKQYDQVGIPAGLHAYYPFGSGFAGEDLAGNNDLTLFAPTDQFAFESDCNSNGIPDNCDIADMTSADCNGNGIPDECDLASGFSQDCNMNGILDECDIDSGFSQDCNTNGVPDSCDIDSGFSLDCNMNGIPDECDIESGFAQDCNTNGIPDDCDIESGFSADINTNGIPDECEIDCNINAIPDEYEIQQGLIDDNNTNGVPDECENIHNTTQNSYWIDIQSALTAADPYDTIELQPGIYNDPPTLTNDRSIEIRGSNPDNDAAVHATRIDSDFVHTGGTLTLTGLSMNHLDFSGTGDRIAVDRCLFKYRSGDLFVPGINAAGNYLFIDFSRSHIDGYYEGVRHNPNGSFRFAFSQCVFTNNEYGIIVAAGLISNFKLDLVNSLFIHNTVGVSVFSKSNGDSFMIFNSIMRDPTPIELLVGEFGYPNIKHSNILGGWPDVGNTNIDADPLFTDADGPDNDPLTIDDNDYRLLPGSPSIDTGDDTEVLDDVFDLDKDADTDEPTPLDLEGNPRFVGTVDMGPYEYQGPQPCPADFTGEGSLNFLDVSAFLSAFGNQDPSADFTGEGQFNFLDVSAFLSAFGAGCP